MAAPLSRLATGYLRSSLRDAVGFFFSVAFLLPLAIVAWRGEVFFAGALIGVPISYFAYRSLCREFIGRPVVAQKATLITYVVTGAGLALGAMLLP